MSGKKAVALRPSRAHEEGDGKIFNKAVKNRVPWEYKGREPLDISVPTEGNFAQRYTKIDSAKENNYNNCMKLEDKLKLLLINDEKISPKKAELLAKEFVMAVRGQLSCSQAQDANLSLPDSAPEIYAERKVRPDLGRKENPIEFIERVWGEYMNAGILYQDDIKRLGDPALVKAVRSYCQREKIRASEVLPPPGSRRATDYLQRADDPELAKAAIRLADRQRKARSRHKILMS